MKLTGECLNSTLNPLAMTDNVNLPLRYPSFVRTHIATYNLADHITLRMHAWENKSDTWMTQQLGEHAHELWGSES